MYFRKAGEKDLNQLSQLFDQYRVFYRKQSDVAGAHNFLKERLLNKDSEIFVAENEEQILAGFVQLYPLFSSTRMKKFWLLNDLFVNPNYRKMGVSIGLIDTAKALVKSTNACGMFLETEKSNIVGNNLYPKAGFELNQASNFYEWNIS
jgi:GNAT superfamily N-acetyltransferase